MITKSYFGEVTERAHKKFTYLSIPQPFNLPSSFLYAHKYYKHTIQTKFNVFASLPQKHHLVSKQHHNQSFFILEGRANDSVALTTKFLVYQQVIKHFIWLLIS